MILALLRNWLGLGYIYTREKWRTGGTCAWLVLATTRRWQVVSYFLVSRLIIVHFLFVLRASHCFICCVRLGCSEFSCRIPFGRMEREREDCHLLRRFLCCGGCCGLHSRCACLTVVAFPRGSPVKKTVSFKISKQIYYIT